MQHTQCAIINRESLRKAEYIFITWIQPDCLWREIWVVLCPLGKTFLLLAWLVTEGHFLFQRNTAAGAFYLYIRSLLMLKIPDWTALCVRCFSLIPKAMVNNCLCPMCIDRMECLLWLNVSNTNFHAENVSFASISSIWTCQIYEPNLAFLEAFLCNIWPIFSRGFSCKLMHSILNCWLNSGVLEKYIENSDSITGNGNFTCNYFYASYL